MASQVTPAQCRAARALINLTQAELAGLAVVPATLLGDFEAGVTTPRQVDLSAIQSALEWAGVEFIERGVRERDGSTST